MAETATTKKTTSKAKTTATKTSEQKTKTTTPIKVDLNEYITVKNGFQGPLVYISKKTGEKFVWEAFGDEQEIELGELKNAKNSAKDFFINNWFMFDEEYSWVIDYLGMGAYYKFTRTIDDIEKFFELSPEEIKEEASKMSDGLKKSISYRARDMITEGTLDSNKLIKALEEALDVELVEK